MATVHMVDASPYIFRAHFSLPSSIKTPDGAPGRGLLRLRLVPAQADRGREAHPPRRGLRPQPQLAASATTSIPTTRRSGCSRRRSSRRRSTTCQEIAAALGAATFIDDRHEADDLIGALCARLREGRPRRRHRHLGQGPRPARGRAGSPSSTSPRGSASPPRTSSRSSACGRTRSPTISASPATRWTTSPASRGSAASPRPSSSPASATSKTSTRGSTSSPGCPRIRGAKSLHAKLAANRDIAFLSKQLATVTREVPGRPRHPEGPGVQGGRSRRGSRSCSSGWGSTRSASGCSTRGRVRSLPPPADRKKTPLLSSPRTTTRPPPGERDPSPDAFLARPEARSRSCFRKTSAGGFLSPGGGRGGGPGGGQEGGLFQPIPALLLGRDGARRGGDKPLHYEKSPNVAACDKADEVEPGPQPAAGDTNSRTPNPMAMHP